jgi:hypothetical protein
MKPLKLLAALVCAGVVIGSIPLNAAEPTLDAVHESIRKLIAENKASGQLGPIESYSASGCHVTIETLYNTRFGSVIRTYGFDLADIEEVIIYVDTGVLLLGGIEEKIDSISVSGGKTLLMHFVLKTRAERNELAQTIAHAFAQARELCTGEHKDPVAKP